MEFVRAKLAKDCKARKINVTHNCMTLNNMCLRGMRADSQFALIGVPSLLSPPLIPLPQTIRQRARGASTKADTGLSWPSLSTAFTPNTS